ncbi:MAG TPA: GNAT family N-acetyltransferase [Bacillota bacterium]|nr:GNAT family N-acetyltransferase [Bacillota bacterium]HPZ59311.1 GNAT family N-acetyltransferase [Bacillota bacterium]HQC81777.1 GNAT family N-acetyltransferase [Bacillota bacterium]
MVDYEISVTDEYERLVEMFIRHGLEFSFDEPLPTDLVKCWKAEDPQGKLIGGCVLAMRGGEYIIDGIATEPEYRKQKIGGELLQLALKEARDRGGKRVYLVARAPGFFRKHGFQRIEASEVPELFDCYSCPQFQKTCHPEVMKLVF